MNATQGQYLSNGPDANGIRTIDAEFSSDIEGSSGDGGQTYLMSVQDPISTCDLRPYGNGWGMSQRGAIRWARGNVCPNGVGAVWPVKWNYQQILAHYYTGIDILDANDTKVAPDDRWNLISHTIPLDANRMGNANAGDIRQFDITLQNTSTQNWADNNTEIYYQWTAKGVPATGQWIKFDGVSVQATNRGNPLSSITGLPITVPSSGGDYTLHLDLYRNGHWLSEQALPWPNATIDIRVNGPIATPTATAPASTPTSIFTQTPTVAATATTGPGGLIQLIDVVVKNDSVLSSVPYWTNIPIGGSASDIYFSVEYPGVTSNYRYKSLEVMVYFKNISGVPQTYSYAGEWYSSVPPAWIWGNSVAGARPWGLAGQSGYAFPLDPTGTTITDTGFDLANDNVGALGFLIAGAEGYDIPRSGGEYTHRIKGHISGEPVTSPYTPTPLPPCTGCTIRQMFDEWIGSCTRQTDSTGQSFASSSRSQDFSESTPPFDIDVLYRVRDEILSQTAQGQHYVDLYETQGPELTEIIIPNSEILAEAVTVLQLWEPNLAALVDGNGSNVTITSEQVQAIETFLDHIYASASPELQQTITNERAATPLDQFVGETLDQAWEEISEIATVTPTVTTTYTPTSTLTVTPTSSFTFTSTPANTPTNTPALTATFTQTPTPTKKSSSTPTATQTSTTIPAGTATYTPTIDPTVTATDTLTPSLTLTPTATFATSFPSTGVLDDFNRADGALGTNWNGGSGAQISSNRVLLDTAAGVNNVLWNQTAFGSNQEAYFTITDLNVASTSTNLSVLVKKQSNDTGSNNYIKLRFIPATSDVEIWVVDSGGSRKVWVDKNFSVHVGDVVGVRVEGMDLKVYVNGTLLHTQDISSYEYVTSSGYIGFRYQIASGDTLGIDDFGGGILP